jgi:salicylate hydroxylase
LALPQADFRISLYERANTLEEFGAGLQLTPNATRVLSRLGVLEDLRSAATSPIAICAMRGSDDSVLARISLDDAERRWGAPYIAMHRADLHAALANAVQRLPNIDLELGTTVTDFAAGRDRVTVSSKRGQVTVEDSADLLVGADGVRSCIRERLPLRERNEAAFTGRVAFRATVDSSLVDSRWSQPEVCLRLGPNAHVVHYPLRRGSVVNLVAVIESAWRDAADACPLDDVTDWHALDRTFAGWSLATRKLLAAATQWRAWPLYSRPQLTSFSFGRVALVGDAAHPMAPFLAQGAAQAIEDAGAIARIFSHTTDVPGALASYSRGRVSRASRVQREALKQGRIYHLGGAMASARDATMRLLGSRGLSARYDWLYGA